MNESNQEEKLPSAENNTKPKRRSSGLIFIFMIVIGFIFITKSEPVNTIDCTPEIIAKKPDVIMLGAWWCTYCYQAKKYFQRNDIHYCEYDMENTAEGKRLYEKHGGGAVPLLLIGKYQLSGYSEAQIEQALTLINK